ncbi:hypothetical protein AB0F81_21675 [Actinoplanes sp. NPDC024001]|uniref:hypothetical protein n=1 Tax=Actinoplanes sp. NPDC024001 TaxID=3154598 RepID=UPI0033ED39CC
MNSRILRIAATLLTSSVVTAGFLAGNTPAQAAGCVESRATARELAASGDFVEARDQMELLSLTIRTSESAGCAWGIVSGVVPGLMSAAVWVDRSPDGGATWVKSAVRKVGPGNWSTYTSAYGTDGYDAVRACGQYSRQNITSDISRQTGISDFPTTSDIYCTWWVAV